MLIYADADTDAFVYGGGEGTGEEDALRACAHGLCLLIIIKESQQNLIFINKSPKNTILGWIFEKNI